jgi:hypothetical protein
MINKNLSQETKISSAITPTAGVAGTTDIEGTVIDMSGFDSVMAIVRMGAITGSAVTSVKWQSGTDSSVSDAADLTGTSITIADDDDDQIFVLDLVKPRERYVRIYVDRATQNAVVASAEYIQYNARTVPITQGSGVTAEVHESPAEGTA